MFVRVCRRLCRGAVTLMTYRGQSGDPVKLTFGLAAELLISNIPFNKAMIQRLVSRVLRICPLVYFSIFNLAANRALSGCLVG